MTKDKLEKMTLTQIREIALKKRIKLGKAATKSEIIKVLLVNSPQKKDKVVPKKNLAKKTASLKVNPKKGSSVLKSKTSAKSAIKIEKKALKIDKKTEKKISSGSSEAAKNSKKVSKVVADKKNKKVTFGTGKSVVKVSREKKISGEHLMAAVSLPHKMLGENGNLESSSAVHEELNNKPYY